MERMTGDTPDISHLIHFDFYQPVYYLDLHLFLRLKRNLADGLDQLRVWVMLMTWKILTDKRTIIARSAVRLADDSDTPNLQSKSEEFDKAVRGVIDDDE